MGLLDYADAAREKLKGLLGGMPLVQMAQGKAEMPTMSGLLATLKAMPVFSPDAGQSAYDAALNIGPMGLGKIVYHGSPHKFDKFDASKIGTGEGAQAYGHGLYLADDVGVAGSYKKPGWDNFDVRRIDGGYEVAIKGGEKVKFKTLDEANKYLNEYGFLYKADLPDEWIPKMLDWDKPLSEQKAVVDQLKKLGMSDGKDFFSIEGAVPLSKVSGADAINGMRLSAHNYGDEIPWSSLHENPGIAASMALRQLGIPGIRYLDGGSRGKGQGSYNYVVFPGLEDQVKILERNGVPLSGLLGGN